MRKRWPHLVAFSKRSSQRAVTHLIRIFQRFLNLYQKPPQSDNSLHIHGLEVLMGKLALYMLGFLALAIGVGLLGTIPPNL